MNRENMLTFLWVAKSCVRMYANKKKYSILDSDFSQYQHPFQKDVNNVKEWDNWYWNKRNNSTAHDKLANEIMEQ